MKYHNEADGKNKNWAWTLISYSRLYHRGEGTLSCTVKKKKKKERQRFIRQIVLQGQNIQIWTEWYSPWKGPENERLNEKKCNALQVISFIDPLS